MTDMQKSAKENAELIINASIKHGNTVISSALTDVAEIIKTQTAKALADIDKIREDVRNDFAKVNVGGEKALKLVKYSAVVSGAAGFAALAALGFALRALSG